MKKTILTDADGLLVQWNHNLSKFNEDKGLPHEHLDELIKGNPFLSIYDIFRTNCPDTGISLLKEYNESVHTLSLPMLEHGADEVIRRLADEFEIIVVSTYGDTQKSYENRRECLEKAYGTNVFSDIICLGIRESKEPVLRKLNESRDVVLWMDDHIHNVIAGLNAGIKNSFQYTHKMICGRNTGEVPEIDSWVSAERFLKNL